MRLFLVACLSLGLIAGAASAKPSSGAAKPKIGAAKPASSTTSLLRYDLPENLVIAVPSSWLPASTADLLATDEMNGIGLDGASNAHSLFAAYVGEDDKKISVIVVTANVPLPAELATRRLPVAEVKAANGAARALFIRQYTASGIAVARWLGTSRQKTADNAGLQSELVIVRLGQKPVFAQHNIILDPPRFIRVTFECPAEKATVLRPAFRRILGTFRDLRPGENPLRPLHEARTARYGREIEVEMQSDPLFKAISTNDPDTYAEIRKKLAEAVNGGDISEATLKEIMVVRREAFLRYLLGGSAEAILGLGRAYKAELDRLYAASPETAYQFVNNEGEHDSDWNIKPVAALVASVKENRPVPGSVTRMREIIGELTRSLPDKDRVVVSEFTARDLDKAETARVMREIWQRALALPETDATMVVRILLVGGLSPFK